MKGEALNKKPKKKAQKVLKSTKYWGVQNQKKFFLRRKQVKKDWKDKKIGKFEQKVIKINENTEGVEKSKNNILDTHTTTKKKKKKPSANKALTQTRRQKPTHKSQRRRRVFVNATVPRNQKKASVLQLNERK